MGKFIDLTNKRFGRLKVLNIENKVKNDFLWKCKCDCGKYTIVSGALLRRGKVKSCGCLKKESDRKPKNNVISLQNQRFSFLTVIDRVGSDSRGEAIWKCKCDCGNIVNVLGSNLRNGHTQSCGCIRMSHGEIKIFNLLCKNQISFEYNYKAFKFENGKYAKFDFYVDDKYFIEYDGETHYNVCLHGWHSTSNLEKSRERDEIKTQWCQLNNIPLIRINYKQYKNLNLNDLLLIPENKNIYVDTGCYFSINELHKTNLINWVPINPSKTIIEHYDKFGNFIQVFCGYKDTEEKLGISHKSLYENITGKSHCTKFGQFKIKDSNKIIKDVSKASERKIVQKDRNNNIVKIFNSIDDVPQFGSKYSKSSILKCCRGNIKTYKNYIWQYYKE